MAVFIDLLGEKLSELIAKSAIASKGLIRFSIKDSFPDLENPNYGQLKKALSESLPNRLKKLQFPDSKVESITHEMLSYLKDNQSVLLLANA